MDGLTPEDIKALQAPLPLEDHEVREKGKNKAGDKKQYLVYINQEGVIPLLNSIDPNWSWDVMQTQIADRYVAVTGRLTIKGVSRDGVGGNSPNGKDAPVDEDTVKGAETDALKRAALRFGVGLYLRSTPTFWIAINAAKPWEEADAATKEFGAWYNRTYKGKSATVTKQHAPEPPANVTPLVQPGNPPPPQPSPTALTGTASGAWSSGLKVVNGEDPASFDEVFGKRLDKVTPDTLWTVSANYFNARRHFDNWWNKHLATTAQMTLDDALAFVRSERWHVDKDQVTELFKVAQERMGLQAGEVMDALTFGNGKPLEKVSGWDGGNRANAYAALCAFHAGYDQKNLTTLADKENLSPEVRDMAIVFCQQYVKLKESA